ncbi:NmrA family protein [Moelleriella libera RCEF 2490]|uniref:NmrA family protein n=1 Tax=Moelleriella libera RCEF 2490 TaxID=1081109 RepID=A0A167YV89_9HYPO|nr:NmrA family protein [Moelleriella libera RCEF 2490]
MDSVLIIGAGELGSCVLESLASHPKRAQVKISVLVRQTTLTSDSPAKKQKIQHLQSLDVRFECADIVAASVDELAAVFSRHHTVVSCSGMELPSGTQTKLAEAALQARVRRFFPWQFGMDYDAIGHGSSQDLFDEQLRVRSMLRGQQDKDTQQETEWVIVSTGLFMSFLFVAAFGIVDLEARVVRGLGSWGNRITVTTPEDIGRVTAEIVLDPQDVRNQVVYTAGDTVSYGDLADVLDEVVVAAAAAEGTDRFSRELWDRETLREQLRREPDNPLVKYRDTFAQGKGVAWDVAGTVNAQRGMPMTDVRRYLTKTTTTTFGPTT